MKKKLFIIIACAVMLVGCGGEQEETTSKESASKTEVTTETTTEKTTEEATTEEATTEETIKEATTEETTTEEATTEETTTEETTTEEVTAEETTTKEATTEETTTEEATTEEVTTEEVTTEEATTEEPTTEVSKETPIVEKIGSVDDERYNKAVNAFESIVKKMRADGLVKETDVCVKLDNDNIYVDITFDNSDVDLYVEKDSASNVYTVTFDYYFCWIEGISPKINGMEPAPYHKELFKATLSMISDDAKTLFDRIDLDCFSESSLSDTEWEEIGDCLIKSDSFKIGEYLAYNIKNK